MGEGPGSRTCQAGVLAQACIRQAGCDRSGKPGVPFPWEETRFGWEGRGGSELGALPGTHRA